LGVEETREPCGVVESWFLPLHHHHRPFGKTLPVTAERQTPNNLGRKPIATAVEHQSEEISFAARNIFTASEGSRAAG
jgi:hypothetical protein